MQTRSGWLLNLGWRWRLPAPRMPLRSSPSQFAYGMPIATPSEAAEYRLEIPPEVYLKSVQPGLRDLQIFNGKGEPVPFTIEQPPVPPRAHPAGTAVPLFPCAMIHRRR